MRGAALLFGAALLMLAGTARADTIEALEPIVPRLASRSHAREAYVDAKGKMHPVLRSFDQVLTPVMRRIKEALVAKHGAMANDEPHLSFQHHMVAMRDGVELSTLVIVPSMQAGEKRGAILGRSPYGPTSDQVADIFTSLNGFVAVIQDQRGTFLSGGEFSMWRNDATDGQDTMDWIAKQPWSNGQVFSVGISADGCGAAAMVLSQPKPLKGQLIQWSSADGHETCYPGGAFREGLVTGWMTMMSVMTQGVSLEKTLPDILAHEKQSDFWKPITGPGHWHQVNWPTIQLSAWWDIFQGHQIDMFNGITALAPKTHEHVLIVGPLGHCMLGNLDADLAVEEMRGMVNAYGLASEVFDGFDTRGRVFRDKLGKVNLYVQGSRRDGNKGPALVGNYWTSLPSWPEPRPHRLYLAQDYQLLMAEVPRRSLRGVDVKSSTESDAALVPDDIKARMGVGRAAFVFDPAKPVLTKGGNNLVLIFLGFGCASEDQRVHESRPDVKVFDSQAFGEPMAITGKITAVLHVSTDARNTDFHVTVTDVHPDGYSMLIRSGLRRLKYRESTPVKTVVSPVEPNQVYRVEIDLWHTSYVLAPGHKIRVSVSSANTPYYAKNDNSGSDHDPFGMKNEVVAKNVVHWSSQMPSYVELPIVSLDQLPENEHF